MCACWSKCGPGTKNSLTLSGILFQLSRFALTTCNMLFLSDKFSKGEVVPLCPPHSQFAMTMVAFRPEDAFFDLIANSISGVTLPSIAVRIAF